MKLKELIWPPSEQEEKRREKAEKEKQRMTAVKKEVKIPSDSEVFQMIRERLPDLHKRRDEILAKTISEYEEDCKNYYADFTRYGDFLHIDMYRATPEFNKVKLGKHDDDGALAVTVPLSNVRGLVLYKGSKPNRKGSLKIYKYSDNEFQCYPNTAEKPYYFSEPLLWGDRNKFEFDPKSVINNTNVSYVVSGAGGSGTSVVGSSHSKQNIIYTIDEYPQYAEDDVISFSGCGKLYIPAGMGEVINDTLHRILKEGYENFYINKSAPKRK